VAAIIAHDPGMIIRPNGPSHLAITPAEPIGALGGGGRVTKKESCHALASRRAAPPQNPKVRDAFLLAFAVA